MDEPFWEALGRGVVELPRCGSCDEWLWPVRPACPHCHLTDMAWVPVEPEGTVYSWTRTWYPFVAERADALPYVVVVAELPGAGGSRVLGVLDGDDDGLCIGARVSGRIAPAGPESLDLPALRWVLS